MYYVEDFQREWLRKVNEMLKFIGVTTWAEADADTYVRNPFLNAPPLTKTRMSPWKKIKDECDGY